MDKHIDKELPTIDTIIIIGNGFDIWQGIHTSYSEFEKFYHDNLDRILKKLHLKPVIVHSPDEPDRRISAVEILYGDPFEPLDLDSDFWNSFESSLDKIDGDRINLFYGKSRSDLKDLHRTVKNADKILKTAFAEWIHAMRIEEGDSGFIFPENCMIVNFNYTDTVEKRFGVKHEDDYHIHGEASDPESIIVGHSSHPEYPLEELKSYGGRFQGLYYIEEILYETDKHVDDNWRLMAGALAMRGIDIKDIKKVYVLGHSFGDADFGYFRHLASALNDEDEDPFEDVSDWQKEYLQGIDDIDFSFLNIQYAIHRGYRSLGNSVMGYPDLIDVVDVEEDDEENTDVCSETPDSANGSGDKDDIDPYYHMSVEQKISVEKTAVRIRYMMEQAERDAYMDKQFEKTFMKGLKRKDRKRLKRNIKAGEKGLLEYAAPSMSNSHGEGIEHNYSGTADKEQAVWYISYYSDSDKKKIIEVMQKSGVTKYQLFSSIDDCIKDFREVSEN